MRSRRPVRPGAFLLGATLVVGLAVAACSDPAPTAGPTSTSRTTSSSTAATTTPKATATPKPAPTTTYTKVTGGPVLAAKIDNTNASRPRVGVGAADVVYVEPVEAGLTRLLAVWTTSVPAQIGPVRSGRETDDDILSAWGRPAFAFSGASAGTLATLAQGQQINLSNDASGVGFRRATDRRAPYNVIGNPAVLFQRAGGATPPTDPGFRFGAAPPTGARSGLDVRTSWTASRIELRWDASRKRYLVFTDGVPDIDADGTQHGAATVVVQQVRTTLSANRDVNGVQSPLVQTVGTGAVDVLRDGRRYSGAWIRPTAASPTLYRAGTVELSMAAGPIWVLLVPVGQAVQIV